MSAVLYPLTNNMMDLGEHFRICRSGFDSTHGRETDVEHDQLWSEFFRFLNCLWSI
jgi:hypothetical protein